MTENENPLPPPFIVGKEYEDEISKYKVLAVDGNKMQFERLDGTVAQTADIPLKARTYRRRLSEAQRPTPIPSQLAKVGSGTSRYKYEDATPLVAEIIEKHSEISSESLPHIRLRTALLAHPEACQIIDALDLTEHLPERESWAGVIIAGFSKQWHDGHWPQFDREKTSKGHAWRVKKR